MRLAVLHEMTVRGALSVVVQKLGRSEYSWMLVRKPSSIALAGCVAASSKHFPDYDQALDAGFEALKAFSTAQIKTLSTCTGDWSRKRRSWTSSFPAGHRLLRGAMRTPWTGKNPLMRVWLSAANPRLTVRDCGRGNFRPKGDGNASGRAAGLGCILLSFGRRRFCHVTRDPPALPPRALRPAPPKQRNTPGTKPISRQHQRQWTRYVLRVKGSFTQRAQHLIFLLNEDFKGPHCPLRRAFSFRPND